jgi:hypothetical protein
LQYLCHLIQKLSNTHLTCWLLCGKRITQQEIQNECVLLFVVA